VYAGTDKAMLYCLDRDSGRDRWRCGIGGPVAEKLVQLAGRMVVGAGAALNFVDPASGKVESVIGVNGLVCGVDEEGGTVVAVTSNRRLVAAGTRVAAVTAPPPKAPALASVVVEPARVNVRRGGKSAVTFSLLKSSPLTVAVADCRGKRVRLLASRDRAWPDTYRFVWEGLDDRGKTVAPGVYRMRVVAGEEEVSVGLEVVGRR